MEIDKPSITYKDQARTEIHDLYDTRARKNPPKMILDAKVLHENNNSKVVHINYPVIDGIWNLDGSVGRCSFYEECGKKAYVRGGFYKHPEKNYKVEIVFMEPYRYIEACAEMFSHRGTYKKVEPEDLIDGRLKDYDLNEMFDPVVGQIFYLTIDLKWKGQEGLHRAVWAMMTYGDTPVPVIRIY